MILSLRKFLPVLVLVFVCFTGAGQQNKNLTTSRILQIANTLLEAQQFDAAEEYFNKALRNGKLYKNANYQAQAYEGLGNLYVKTKQKNLAVASYEQAILLYKKLGYKVLADVVGSLLKSVLGVGDLYAGVEIGAKGIKLSIIDVKLSDGETDYVLKADTSINTDAAALSYQSEKETREAISRFYKIIREKFRIPPSRTYMVISSGLKQDLDRFNKVEYFAKEIRPSELDPTIKIRYVNVDEEAQLNFKGVVPQMDRMTSNQLDVGSGNTKGGYVNNRKKFIPVTFPLGTKSFQRLVEARAPGNLELDQFQRAAEKLIIDSLGRMIIYEFRDKTEYNSKDIVYLSGGIVWALASLLHPELIRQNHVELTGKDIANFRKLVYSSYEEMTHPDLAGKMSSGDAAASLANIKRVAGTYDQKAMIAGSILLDEIVQQVNKVNPDKKFVYSRYAYVGWISGYIIDKINKQYTELALN